MNWDQIAGNWKQFKGHVKEKWGKLTDDDLDVDRRQKRPTRRQVTGAVWLLQGSRRKKNSKALGLK